MLQLANIHFSQFHDRSEKSPVNQRRIGYIIEYLTYEIFRYKSRGLYETHKYMFILLMTLKIDLQRGSISHEEFQYLIKGGAALDLNAVAPKPAKWITDVVWLNLIAISSLRQFQYIPSQIPASERAWKSWFDKDAPEEEVIPDGYNTLDTFRRLLLIRHVVSRFFRLMLFEIMVSQNIFADYAVKVVHFCIDLMPSLDVVLKEDFYHHYVLRAVFDDIL